MKRGKKLLILAAVLIVVAGGAFAALEFIPDEEAEVTESEVIYSLDAATLTKLSWTYDGETVSFDYNGEDWTYADDADFPLDPTRLNTMLSTLEEVTASKTIEAADGNTVYETREEEKSFTLELGDYAGEGVYARIAGSEMVYLIDSAICDSLLYTEVSELLPDDVILLDWDRTEGFDITLDGETYAVTMALEESTDDEGSTSYDYVYTLNGEDVDFTDVLNSLEALESEGSAEGVSTELGEAISFVFHRSTETFTEVTLTIYNYDSTTCIASLSEGRPQFVSRDAVEDIVEAVTALVAPAEE